MNKLNCHHHFLNSLKVVIIMTVNGMTCDANESKTVLLIWNKFQNVDFDTFSRDRYSDKLR